MLSNAYFLAKFRFDTAENEPAKNLQNFRKMQEPPRAAASRRAAPPRARRSGAAPTRPSPGAWRGFAQARSPRFF